MPGARTSARPLSLGLIGVWVELVEPAQGTLSELQRFHDERRLTPAMGTTGQVAANSLTDPMLIRERATGRMVGSVESYRLPGGVVEYTIYLDAQLGRPGYGLEATALYVSHLFDAGARLVTFEVMSFNREVIGIMRKAVWPVRARLREQAYVAGRYWDVLVYSFNQAEWERGIERYRRRLPGGDLRPTAVGRRRPIEGTRSSS